MVNDAKNVHIFLWTKRNERGTTHDFAHMRQTIACFGENLASQLKNAGGRKSWVFIYLFIFC